MNIFKNRRIAALDILRCPPHGISITIISSGIFSMADWLRISGYAATAECHREECSGREDGDLGEGE